MMYAEHRMFALKLLLTIATIGLALPAQAAPAPIVFDFEDGLQGWELHGGATRVQTQVLGGEWAIFLDGFLEGGASIFIPGDLQTVGSVTFDQLTIAGSGSVVPVLRRVALVNNVLTDFIEIGFPVVQGGVRPEPPIAFIDNITFHPVPEPGTLGLLAGSLAALVIARCRIV